LGFDVIGKQPLDIIVEFQLFSAHDTPLNVIVSFSGFVPVHLFSAFGKQHVYVAFALAARPSYTLQLLKITTHVFYICTQTYHPDRSLLRIVAHYQVYLPYIKALFSDRCGYKNVKDAVLELLDDLGSEEYEETCIQSGQRT